MNCYQILGVAENASYEEISRSFQILAKKYNLEIDKSPDAKAAFQKEYEAYITLTDNEMRRNYEENTRTHNEYIDAEISHARQNAQFFSKERCRNTYKSYLTIVKAVLSALIAASFTFIIFSFDDFRHIEQKLNKDIGYFVLPGIPDINNYDAIFIGENHMSVQNFDIEFNLMKYYYSLGIRDFLFECGFADALFKQYYFDSGDEECFSYLFRTSGGRLSPRNSGAIEFYRKIYQWNSALEEKINVHGFDVEHDYSNIGIAAIWFFILRKYPDIEGVPFVNDAPGFYYEFIDDFRNNRQRYSAITPEDMALFERLVKSLNQGEYFNDIGWNKPMWENYKERTSFREESMAENFREIKNRIGNRKVLAIMGYYHSALNGQARFLFSDRQFPSIPIDKPSMGSTLKNDYRIASIVLRSFRNPARWPYSIRIKGWKLANPHKTDYEGNWPYE